MGVGIRVCSGELAHTLLVVLLGDVSCITRCPDVPTIERDLLAAMRKAQAFPECMEEDLAKVRHW